MARFKTFLLSFLIAALSIVFIAGCSTDTSSSNLGGGSSSGTDNGGGQTKPNVTPVNEFPKNPFALLGVYDITSQSVNGTSQNVTAGSEFRVNVDTARLETGFVDVLIRLSIDGKIVEFSEEVSLAEANGNLDSAFFEKVFTNMGAKVTGAYTLEFTLDSTMYTELVSSNIIQDGDILVINLDKTKDLQMNAGLDDSTETPETPSEPVKVESIQITTPEKSYYTGSTVTIDFTLNPSNTTETDVTYQTTNNGSGTVKAVNGKGQLVLENVTQNDTVLFTIANNQQDSFNITIVDEVESISFLNATEVIEQNQSRIIGIENYDVIKDAFSSITYSVVDDTKASINSTTGEVTGLKNGVTQVNVTATRLDGQQLTASYELDVLGLVDFTSNETFKESAQGTYEISFFGTNPGKATACEGLFCDASNGQTEVPVTTDCELYKELFSTSKCEGGGFVKNIIVDQNSFVGRATVTVNSDGSAIIHTKILMTASTMASNSPNDQYQYSVYRTTNGSDTNNKNGTVKGITGRHLTSNGTWDTSIFDIRQYQSNLSKDVILYSHIYEKNISIPVFGAKTINPETYIIMKKISSKPEKMDYSNISQNPFNRITGINPTDLGEDAPLY